MYAFILWRFGRFVNTRARVFFAAHADERARQTENGCFSLTPFVIMTVENVEGG